MKRCILMFALLIVTLMLAILVESTNEEIINNDVMVVKDNKIENMMLGTR